MKINKTPSPDRLSIKKWLITDSTDRLYLFIDESGDAGIYTGENSGASKYFMINVLVASSKGVNILEKHFSRYRYFKNADKELKRYRQHKNDQDILDDLLVNISSTQNVMSFSFCIDKEKYIGPYLNSIGRNENYKLPVIQFINQLDSNYCAQLQMADVLGSLVKRKVFDGENIDTKDIKIFVTDNPDSVIELKEKGPDTQRGTGTLPSMGT
jgi:hypothetical protein